jgi:uncharacterized iron-regulated protein
MTAVRFAVLLLLAAILACASEPGRVWEPRLSGDAIVLLGEVHDNAEQHRLRLALLRRAFAAGWRPAIALEQIDRERQADIERARREQPDDAQHVIDLAAPAAGWSWDLYRPYVALALEYDVPLVAANLSAADAKKIVRGGLADVFHPAALARLGLDREVPSDWQAAQEREIDAGHCHALPRTSWPAMARVQFARDAVMAEAVRAQARRGVVLLAGNGHVRRDFGVPAHLRGRRVLSVGFVERASVDEALAARAYDFVLVFAPHPREDPCAGLQRRFAAPPKPG